MGKRLTVSDYLFAFLFVFMIFCIIVAFFYGVNVGKSKAEEQYRQLMQGQLDELPNEELTSYHQQHLVSFYYNVYYPFRTFQSSWTNTVAELSKSPSADVHVAIRKLSKTAKEVYQSVEIMTIPDQSPLLQQAQTNYLRSLRLFQEADARVQSYDGTNKELIGKLLQDPYIVEAIDHATTAQAQYYQAIVYWHDSVVVELEGMQDMSSTDLDLTEWAELPFNVQNSIVAQAMSDNGIFVNYTPQDLTAVIMAMIDSGRSKVLGLRTIEDAVTILHHTNAVRSGDYFFYRDAYFKDEIVPQLPFYQVES